MLFNLLAYLGVTKSVDAINGDNSYSKAADKAIRQVLIVLLGIALGIAGMVFIVSGTNSGKAILNTATAIATKGKI